MPRYFFHLRDGTEGIRDAEGVDLPDEIAGRAYARSLASELMKNREPQTRHWLLDVTEEIGQVAFQLPFATVDQTLDHLTAATRNWIEQRCEKSLAQHEEIERARVGCRRSRALVGRSRGKPYLCTDRWGERVA
jgi:hypothetical protein